MIRQEKDVFSIGNKFFCRTMKVDAQGVRTVSFKELRSNREFAIIDDPPEFTFRANEVNFNGYSKENQTLKFEGARCEEGDHDSEILKLDFSLPDGGKVSVATKVYPDLAGCTRYMEFTAGPRGMALDNLVLETLNLAPGLPADCTCYREQGTIPALPEFTIVGSDDLLRGHDPKVNAGFFTGSSIPGPLRYVMNYNHWASGIMYGYGRSLAVFAKYLAPGESWKSDEIFTLLYSGKFEECTPANDFRELIRRSLPPASPKAGFMYCTWIPFLTEISEYLVAELAPVAKSLNVKTLVLDDGWFVEDKWRVNPEKFPNGLEGVSKCVHASGLGFGLWFNIGTDYGSPGSEPTHDCLLQSGETKMSGTHGVRCFASAHRESIAAKLNELAEKYTLDYFKMDFSNIISPYGVQEVGCSSTAHAYHRNSRDAVIEQYRGLYSVREAVKSAHPELALDYSFEVFGTETPGVAGLQYSDFQHVSNLTVGTGKFNSARRIRCSLYTFTALLPPERVSGALIELQDEGALENLYTSLIGNPLFAGDLRKLTPEQKKAIASVGANFQRLSAKGELTEMQRLHKETYVAYNQCDGYFRWSKKSGEGMGAIFANESGAKSMTVALAIPDERPRLLRNLADNSEIGCWSAAELRSGVNLSFGSGKLLGFSVELA